MNSCGWIVDEDDEAADRSRLAKTDRHHSFSKKIWYEMYKATSSSKAISIDQDQDNQDEGTSGEYSQWGDLPSLALENVFSHLSMKEKYNASCVCKNWNRAFYLPSVWKEFTLDDRTLTRSKMNYHLGRQYVLDHLRTSLCLQTVGKHFRRLVIKPMMNFSNLYEFMNILSWYIEQNVDPDSAIVGVGHKIQHLTFTFPCNMTTRQDGDRTRLFGTGGKLLAGLKRLMGNLKNLRSLKLTDLLLESSEAQFLLDQVCQGCCFSLKSLSLINTTRIPYQVLHIGVFLNMLELHISPQNLGDDLVELLSFTKLKHLHIVQNSYTIDDGFIKSVDPRCWKNIRSAKKDLNVHLQVVSKTFKSIVWQEGAPIRSVVYDSPQIGLKTDQLITAIDLYKDDLRTYGHMNIPRFFMARPFTDRNDENLVMLTRSCTYLTTLIVTERISTSTVLLLAYTGRNLKWLHIRGNAVIIKCDWRKSPDWTNEFYTWLKSSSRSYQLVENEVSQILKYKWKFLPDKDFRRLKIDLHDS